VKVLYCNKYNFPFSGTEVYLFELMALMRAHGHEAELFSMADDRGQPTKYDEFFAPHVDFKRKHLGRFTRAKLAAHAIYSPGARHHLRRMIEAFRPSVAHVRNVYHHLSPSIFWELKAQKIPVVYHLNDFKLLCPTYNFVAQGHNCEACKGGHFINVITQGCYGGTKSAAVVLAAEAYFHRWIRTYKTCVDQFIAPSEFVKQKLMQNGFEENRIRVIPHFQRLPQTLAPALGAEAPILYFGRLSAEKGIGDLVRAMRQVPAVKLSIAGDGPQKEELQSLVRNLGLDNVTFAGHLSGADLERAIAASRFTVLPSLAYETLGKSILESYAWGRPVIATDLGSRRELVDDGETGLLYEPGNVTQLAEKIRYLADRPELANAMGAAGRKIVETRHTPDRHYAAMTEVYEQLLASAAKQSLPARPRPKVAFIGARGVVSKYSGIESYYEETGKLLVQQGYEVIVYCRSYFTPDLPAHEGMRLVRLPTIRSKHLETVVHTLLSTIHVMFSNCDIVHFHALGPALFSYFPRLTGKKTLVTVQGLDWQRTKWGRVAASVLRLGELASARLPNRTVVVSKVLQKYYRDLYQAETAYIPNGTLLRRRSAPSQITKWGLEADRYILFLGRFSPEKNCHLLIEAYKCLDTPVKLVFAGGSSHTDSYVASLRQHSSEKIVFLDWVAGEAFNELLTNAALFVLPSDMEGLSLALLDAMGAGVCVLTSDIPENRELVDGVGFTFRRGDVQDLARMLTLLVADDRVRRQAGQNAQQRVREQFLWPGIAVQISQVYRELLGETQPSLLPAVAEHDAQTAKPAA
jgi:glycosyltransferase involved in cell wall biosynthesis